jgi:hypothetical protein
MRRKVICLLKREIKECARTMDPAEGLIGKSEVRIGSGAYVAGDDVIDTEEVKTWFRV